MKPKMCTIASMLYQVYVANNKDSSLIRSINECAAIFIEDVAMNNTYNYIHQLGEIFSNSKEMQPQILLATFIKERLGENLVVFIEQIRISTLQQEIKEAIIEEFDQQ
jgi:ATP-dependent Lon protease